jgi:eukaryotic-like serine/threonine-protein kinase
VAEEINGYKLMRIVGNGAASKVWEVVEQSSHRHFAMKILVPEKAGDRALRAALFHEAEVGIALRHQNVIQIISVSKDAKKPHFIMEFFPAGSLGQRLKKKEVDFIRQNLAGILKQAATGLAYMNASGWVHRDIKPDNFLVSAKGDVKIIDFAISAKVGGSSFLAKLLGMKTPVQGTRSYMSPEQIRGEGLDGRADVYSFGATCYELVTNRPPFRAASNGELLQKQLSEKPASPQMHNPDVSDEFAKLILRMIAKKKEERPASFHEVLMQMRPMKLFKSDAKAGS